MIDPEDKNSDVIYLGFRIGRLLVVSLGFGYLFFFHKEDAERWFPWFPVCMSIISAHDAVDDRRPSDGVLAAIWLIVGLSGLANYYAGFAVHRTYPLLVGLGVVWVYLIFNQARKQQ